MRLLCVPVLLHMVCIMEVSLTNTLQVHISAIIQLCIAFLLGSIRMKFDFKHIVRYVSYVHISTHMNVVWSSGSYDSIYMYRSMTAVHK